MPKKTSKSPRKSNAKPNKSELIRSHASLKPAELVAKGKEAGLDFKIEYVYAIRQAQKKKTSKGKAKIAGKAKSTLKVVSHKRFSGSSGSASGSHARHHEDALRRAVLDLGVNGVQSLLVAIEKKFLAI